MIARLSAVALAILALASCTTTTSTDVRPGVVERMYVIDCGENHVSDLSRWTPGENQGKAWVFGNHCYLIRHAQGWMLWDTGNPDRIAALPNGLRNPNGLITAFMKQPLAESLKAIGVAPASIQHFAMSHGHGDHSGNANLFGASMLYMQAVEHDAVFGPESAKFGFIPANFEQLRGSRILKLEGLHDVFGDGAVTIMPAPGHTPGHQVLAVRLPRTGLVVLSGDMAGDGPAMVQDGRAAALWGAGIGWPGFTALAKSGARFVGPSASEIASVLAKNPALKPLTMPAGAYPGIDKPIGTVGSWSFVLARADLADDVGYRLARALHRAEAPLAARLAQARETTSANTVAAAPRPDLIHPGVQRYLREAGLL